MYLNENDFGGYITSVHFMIASHARVVASVHSSMLDCSVEQVDEDTRSS